MSGYQCNGAKLISISFQAEEFLDEDEEFQTHEDKKSEEGDEEDESELDVGEAADLSPQNQKLVRCLRGISVGA